MDEQLIALLEGINALKNDQEETRKEMQKEYIEDFEKKLLAFGNATNESKFVPAALVPVPASPVSVKLYTYDAKINWEVYKIQFGLISEEVKAFQVAASLEEKLLKFCRHRAAEFELPLYCSGSARNSPKTMPACR
ncbi:hypothetical protein TNCV_3034461 [Trichonephila clavipes]|nr:hypothetical protein TNCV_3034461 [Trichonephila clavipes]